MIIIIPLGGSGLRFKNFNYRLPKPLISVLGKPIIFWLLDNLIYTEKITHIIIPYHFELARYNFEEKIQSRYLNSNLNLNFNLNFIFIKLEKETRGALETIMFGLNYLEKNNITDQPIISLDGDNFYLTDILKLWNGTNTVFSFIDDSDSSIYSYVEIKNNNYNNIINIVEKNRISDIANTGAYAFQSWKNLKFYIEKVINKKLTYNNEFYISCVIQYMIKHNNKFKCQIIDKSSYVSLGTPLAVRLFANNHPVVSSINNKYLLQKLNIIFYIENVIFDKKYNLIQNNINFLNYLKKIGNRLILKSSYSVNYKIDHAINYGIFILNLLDRHNIQYDELYFENHDYKADYIIDDINKNYIFDNLEKETGFYDSIVKPRDFNQLNISNINIFTKRSTDLSGEIYYYLNIPKTLKDMFPLLFDYDNDNKWYTIENINGIPISKLFINNELTECILNNVMNSIQRIHNTIELYPVESQQSIDIYANYVHKITDRYNKFKNIYINFDNHENYFNYLLIYLKDYQNSDLGKIGVIHGDPILTNILINNLNKLKFIDMRGTLDGDLTIFGDIFYDWAKLYQSLIGYDEILENINLNINYKESLINIYEKKIINLFGRNQLKYIKIITASLLFSLIPLHYNEKNEKEKCNKYYSLMKNIIDNFISSY